MEDEIAGDSCAVTIATPFPAVFSSTNPKSKPKPSLVMKPIIPFALLGALLAVGAADAAATDPVGYITHTVVGNPGALSAGAVTYLSPTLIQPTIFAGATTVSPSGLTTLTFTGGVPVGLTSASVLEIETAGANQGWWSTVVSSTATSITVLDTLPAGLPAATAISVRNHTTVKNFLGANAAGLTAFNGVAVNDEVLVLNPVTQVTTTLAYVPAAVSGEATDGWFDLGASLRADSYIIEPGSSVQVKRFGAGALTFTSSGEVKTTNTQVDVFPKFNWVGTFSAAGNTLNGMGFATSLILFNGANTNFDQLQFINANQSSTTYAAVDPSFFGAPTVGNLGDSSNAGTVPFAEGVGAILIRANTEAASTITIPGSTVAP